MKPWSREWIQQYLPISVLSLLNLLIGTIVVRDYGASWDEPGIYTYAKQSIRAYVNLVQNGTLPHFTNLPTNVVNYGPAYAMITALLAQGLHAIVPGWSEIDGWHLGEFLAFQVSIVSLYFLARKWMGGWAALGTTLLYSTQPILWGHAFINPKDIPFLGFFLASITAGLYLVDALPVPFDGQASHQLDATWTLQLREHWKELPSSVRRITVVFGTVYLGSLCLLVTGAMSRLVQGLVTYLYNLSPTSLMGSWFSVLAKNKTYLPASDYVHKAQALLLRAEVIYVIAGLFIGLIAFVWVSWRYARKWRGEAKGDPMRLLRDPRVLAAGCLLGFTTSIRVAGPYAGIIVLLYAFYRSWRKAVLLLVPYAASAVLTSYLTWPYLWSDAAHRFLGTILLMSHYPFNSQVLFQGGFYPTNRLPVYFLPYLMSIQLTEIVPILFLFGLALSARNLVRGQQVEPFSLTVLWFVFPLLGIIVEHSVLYDNFRQELFLLPPVFVTAGVALESLFSRMKRTWLKLLVVLVVVLPGLYADVTLHPYQYVYYNGFVGGEAGAFRRFDLDYWAVSYREAALYINQVAPVDATVVLTDPLPVFEDYARQDLEVVPLSKLNPGIHYDFVVLNTRKNQDISVCPSVAPVKTIARNGAILTIIKAPAPSVKGCP